MNCVKRYFHELEQNPSNVTSFWDQNDKALEVLGHQFYGLLSEFHHFLFVKIYHHPKGTTFLCNGGNDFQAFKWPFKVTMNTFWDAFFDIPPTDPTRKKKGTSTCPSDSVWQSQSLLDRVDPTCRSPYREISRCVAFLRENVVFHQVDFHEPKQEIQPLAKSSTYWCWKQ